MAFITKTDLLDYVKASELATVSESDDDIITRVIRTAEEEAKGYMRHRYKVATIFAQSSTNRDDKLIQVCVDIALYHLFSSAVPRNIPETRIQRYDDSIKWLEKVQRGTITMDLEVLTDTDGKQQGHTIQYGNKTTIF